MKKLICFGLLIAGLGFLGWKVYEKIEESKQVAGGGRRGVAAPVDVEPVRLSSIRDIRRFSGTLQANTQFLSASKISGRVVKILVHAGDSVKKGQLIAKLDDDEFIQQVSQAKAELDVARAGLEERKTILANAEREYRRIMALQQKNIASEAQLDTVESEFRIQEAKLKVAAAQVSRQEAALKAAEIRLAYTNILVEGDYQGEELVVGQRFVDGGAMIAANVPIVSILDISRLIAVIHVIEQDYASMKPGLTAAISTDAYPNLSFSGQVIRISPIIDEKSRKAKVEVVIPNPQQLLKPGMFVRADILFSESRQAIVVPTDALVRRNGIRGIFIVDENAVKARFVPVTTGIVEGLLTEILKPELSGSFITLGQHLLEDGSPILLPQVKRDEPSPEGSGKPEPKPVLPAGKGKSS